MKILNKIKENKIFFVVFGILIFSSISYLSQKDFLDIMNSYYAPLYVVNFECGFSSRLLIGSIFSLFFKDKLSLSAIIFALLVIYFVMCLCLSLFVNNRLKKTPYDKTVGMYIVFFAICPVSMSFLKYFGATDMFWIFCVIGSLLVVDKKFLRWLLPVFCVVALAIHEVFATTYLPLIAIAVLYQFIKKPNVNNFLFISICALIVGAASVYFLFIGDGTMKMTSDEMAAFAHNRLDLQGKNWIEWYMRSIFFWEVDELEKYTDSFDFLGYLEYNLRYYILNNSLNGIILQICSNLLAGFPSLYLVFSSIKRTSHPGKKFLFICCLLSTLVLTSLLFFSTDTERFSQHFLLSIIFMTLFFIKEKDTSFENSYNCLIEKINTNKSLFAFFGLMSVCIILLGF